MEQEEAKKTSGRMDSAEAKKTSNRVEKTAAQKIADVAEMMAAKPRKKESKKDAILVAVKAQEKQFKKALKNGYTRKEIIANLKEQGITITARDLAGILGTRAKAEKAEKIPHPKKKSTEQVGVTTETAKV